MNILIDIAHPAHVHLVRNTNFELMKRGHKVYVTVRNIPTAIELLDKYNIPYLKLGGKKDSFRGKIFWQILYNLKMWQLVISKKIDIGFGTSITLPQISRLTKMKSIVLDDDDDVIEPLFVLYAHTFANVVLSPACTQRATKKNIPYNGYHELAYLHPNYFTPNASILSEIGVKEGDTFFLLRFNAFKAHHDVGVQGLSLENKRELIDYLEKRGRVFITTERCIDDEFMKYQLLISPEKVHSLLYYATMFIGDSQTMTSEAAIMGVPAVKCNSFAGKLSVPNELEKKYQLCYSFLPDQSDAFFAKIDALLNDKNIRTKFKKRKEFFLADKIDVTAFFVWFIENYPQSKNLKYVDKK